MAEFGDILKNHYHCWKSQIPLKSNMLHNLSKARRDYLHEVVKEEIFDCVRHLYQQEPMVTILYDDDNVFVDQHFIGEKPS
jgi:hypothetical protein